MGICVTASVCSHKPANMREWQTNNVCMSVPIPAGPQNPEEQINSVQGNIPAWQAGQHTTVYISPLIELDEMETASKQRS